MYSLFMFCRQVKCMFFELLTGLKFLLLFKKIVIICIWPVIPKRPGQSISSFAGRLFEFGDLLFGETHL